MVRLQAKQTVYQHGLEIVTAWLRRSGLLAEPEDLGGQILTLDRKLQQSTAAVPEWFARSRSEWPRTLDPNTVPAHVYDAWLDWKQKNS